MLAGILSGCGTNSASGGKDKKTIVIGAAMPIFDDKWLSYLYDAIRAYDKEHDDVEVKMVDAKNDSGKQLSQVETFISQGVDAIIIAPADTDTAGPMVDAANEANIPVIIVNRKPDDKAMKKIYAYVGSESLEAGTIQMEKVAELIGGKGNIGLMNGQLGQEAAAKRTEGNKELIKKKYPDIKIVREATANWQRSEAITLMENWIQSGEHFDAIVANNDEMAIGAIMALEESGKRGNTVIAGVDGTIDALKYVKDGTLNISTFQDPMGQGKGAVEAAIKAVKGEKAPKDNFINIPFQLITKDNVDEFIKKWEK
ncbi:rhizopine-binding protein [Neobacillus vireti]|nr:rhizopine-binding protein [Neobacillus vireti]